MANYQKLIGRRLRFKTVERPATRKRVIPSDNLKSDSFKEPCNFFFHSFADEEACGPVTHATCLQESIFDERGNRSTTRKPTNRFEIDRNSKSFIRKGTGSVRVEELNKGN